jgi:hypothetical protein
MSAELERILADALTSAEPVESIALALADPALPMAVRAQLTAIDADGLRIAALLVAKLRFERVLNASHVAAQWFERDPEAFTEAFRRYHTSVPPTELGPSAEARRFEAWIG